MKLITYVILMPRVKMGDNPTDSLKKDLIKNGALCIVTGVHGLQRPSVLGYCSSLREDVAGLSTLCELYSQESSAALRPFPQCLPDDEA